MNLERLRWGEWIAAISALDLLLVTFRAWYKVSGGDGKVSAWDALSSGRYLLLATAVVGLFLLVIVASEQAAQLSFPPGALAAIVGLGCTVYIAYRMATPPADTLDADIGLYFGLASALGVALGGLISAREAAEPAFAGRDDSSPPAATFTGPTGPSQAPLGELVPDTGGSGTWSPAQPTPAPSWSPSAPVPPATAAGAGFGAAAPASERSVRAGDDVVLTTGGARFPAGTLARVIEVFGGGALVEVTAADGVPERFEVPEDAFERLAAAGGESWSPAMPAPAGEDWGFDDQAATGAPADAAAAADEPATAEPAPDKVPFWKREIGGKKKRETAAAEAGAASALAAAPIAEAAEEATEEERPGLFKRMFGGGKKAEEPEADATPDAWAESASEPAADADATPSIVDEPASADEPEVVVDPEPEPEPPAPEPVVIVEPEPEPERVVEPEPEPPAPEPVVIVEPEPAAPEPEPEPPAPEPEVLIDSAPEPEVVIDAPEPEPEEKPKRRRSSGSRKVPEEALTEAEPEPEPPAPEPDVVPDPEPEPEPPAPEPELVADPEPEVVSDPEPEGVPNPEPEVVAEPEPVADEEPKPKRKRSSGARKVPQEALGAAAGEPMPPLVGDHVQLKVGGGKYDAGTRGTVVDVFSAGVIVELVADDGRTERLDLPFEAVGPADA